MSQIKLITFKTSLVNIIGEVTESFDSITIKQPCQVVIQKAQPDADNEQLSVGFIPMLAIAESWSTGITFPRSEVFTINEPLLNIRNKYSEAFGSGLTIARTVPGKIHV